MQSENGPALVTGASGGIGYELAKQLARAGHDLVLVARSEDTLHEIADDFKSTYDTEVHVIAQDLAEPGAAHAVQQATEERGVTVEVLVNNAGIGACGPFAESDLERQTQMMQLNVMALTQLTRLFVEGMVKRGRGRILNVASTAAFQPGPLMAVYYATKAYVLSFSEALAEELREDDVTVTALCPGPTATNFQERADAENSRLFKRMSLMDAEKVAAAGYRGMQAGKPVVIPGVMNKLGAQSVRFAPRRLVPKVTRWLQEPSS